MTETADRPLFARQPIFDSDLRIVGYELLYRGMVGNHAVFENGSEASAQVLINALTEVDLMEVVDGKRAFVNFTLDMLSAVPEFAKKHLVIELLEDVPVTPHLIRKLGELKARGFTLALDDYGTRRYPRELLNLIDVVKIDLLHVSPSRLPMVVESLESFNIQLLAEKVETLEDYDRCRVLGFEMYQGYFFSYPQIISGRSRGSDRHTILELISTLYREDVQVRDVVGVINRDPAIAVKLLRLVNSALYRRQRNIQSIQQAITMLGLNRLRSWITLLLLDKNSDRGSALTELSLFHAFFCQAVARETHPPMADAAFTVGLLSCLDAFFDEPMAALLKNLPLDTLLQQALLANKGRLGAWLRLGRFMQRYSAQQVSENALEKLGLTREKLSELQQLALQEVSAAKSVLQGHSEALIA